MWAQLYSSRKACTKKAEEILGILKEYVWHGKLTSWLLPVYITVPHLCQRMDNASVNSLVLVQIFFLVTIYRVTFDVIIYSFFISTEKHRKTCLVWQNVMRQSHERMTVHGFSGTSVNHALQP
jgi:hypothetical protein